MRTTRPRSYAPDGAVQHRDWLELIEITGPFLSLPVLRRAWPTLDPLERPAREALRRRHGEWQDDPVAGQRAWIDYVLGDLLGWDDALRAETADLDALSMDVAEHDTRLTPSFALVEPGEDVKPDTARVLGMVCDAGQQPTARIAGSAWAATPADRLAALCRHHDVELGLATDGRWWALVWAPRGKATTTAVFDALAWSDAAERDVVRAFVSLLCRRRFFGVADEETLVPLLRASLDSQEEITEALGVQVREAVELLVAALGREDTAARRRGETGLEHVDAHEVYRGAVSVMMRIVFLLFAEERGLLPADNELYASTYSAGRLCAELERRALEGSEDDLEYTSVGWHRLLALFAAVYGGVSHPRLTMHAHDGSLFDPAQFPWLELAVDDRTVLHMLRAVQHVEIGTGRSRERRTLSFRSLDVEQIGYVYEGLLSFDGFRATAVVLGLAGKRGQEVELRELEALAARCADVPALAALLAIEYKNSGVGSSKALEKRLGVRRGAESEDARRKLLAVVRGDYPLAERLLPFFGVIRWDLRELPTVIMPGALYVTDSPLRRNTGTHYTPRELAEDVVHHALEPLVYAPGPLQTAATDEWKLRSSSEILALKVADIAMGSAAFLVAAARYLGARLLEAWTLEGDERAQAYSRQEVRTDEDPVVVDARRQVIEHCLYGVDINPMAVEMAKLSLWLVSMDPARPFTFLDDRLAAGDSLLGITSLEQLEYMHLDPVEGRRVNNDRWAASVPSLVADVARERRGIAEVAVGEHPLEGLAEKRARLYEAWSKVDHLTLFADLLVGASLAGHRKRVSWRDPHLRAQVEVDDEMGREALLVEAARLANDMAEGRGERKAREAATRWLATDLPDGGFRRDPLHWPLVFPEVFEQAGFDAIISNPPFLGGKRISGPLGPAYREQLVTSVGHGIKGNADLVAFFALRAHDLLGPAGQGGLIATNTLAQGDTREVGLDQLTLHGTTVRRAVKGKPWPSRSAALEYCAVWTSNGSLAKAARRYIGETLVRGITSSLDPVSRVVGRPDRLAQNRGLAFIGSFVNGIGFVLSREDQDRIFAVEPRSREVVFPYLNGQDINSTPSLVARRAVINFGRRTLAEAEQYPECLDRVRKLVKPERDALPSYKSRVRDNWWKFEYQADSLYRAIEDLERVLVVARISRTVIPVFVPTVNVLNEKVVAFGTDDEATLALISSAHHYWWVRTYSATLKTDIQYAPTDAFETFPLAVFSQELRRLGGLLDVHRRDVMLARDSGLTKTYNLVFDPTCTDDDIRELRRIHREIDAATIRAYGWEDRIEAVGGLDHGFHPVGRETRYTVGPAAQREILDSLLELNHERYADEVARGLHDKGAKAKAKRAAQQDQGAMFDVE